MKLVGGWMTDGRTDGRMVRQGGGMKDKAAGAAEVGWQLHEGAEPGVAGDTTDRLLPKKGMIFPQLCPRVHTPVHALALSGLSGLSGLSLSLALLPGVHIMFVVLPLPDLFPHARALRLLPADLYLSPHLPHSYPDQTLYIYIYLYIYPYLPCSGASLFVIYIYIYIYYKCVDT